MRETVAYKKTDQISEYMKINGSQIYPVQKRATKRKGEN